MRIPFDNSYSRLPDRFFARRLPARVPEPALIRVNRPLAVELGLDPAWLESPEGVAALAGNEVPEGADPLAQAYAGHQFGSFVPQLGDGRAILLGEVVTADGERRDIQLKGSGRTAFSRGGDGKAALGPVLREFIVSEAMAALGVKTTRALAAVTTGERILRHDGWQPGAVFTRVAASHVRVGTFEYFRARQDVDGLRLLADHVIARHHPQAAVAANQYVALLDAVIAAHADLIAHWLSLGFVHGVMNTDNTSISGETIDYGPCAFVDRFHPQAVFSSIDRYGRYAWGSQPDIGAWNLTRFAETLLPLLHDDKAEAIRLAEGALAHYADRFAAAYLGRFRAKLALPDTAPAASVQACLDLLAAQDIDFTLFFRRLTQVAAGDDVRSLSSLFKETATFETWLSQWRSEADVPGLLTAMRRANPVLIPRNHRVEAAIQAGNDGDYAPFHRLVDALAAPYDDRPEYADLEQPPRDEELVRETFCGT
jgi:serine/tyrosine/threonine adenylyltransferase